MFGIGPMELVVIVVVALLIFGPQRLPEFARTLGKGLAEVRRASNDLRQTLALDELQNDLRKTMNQATSPPPAESRPAQAGDTLPPGTPSANAAGHSAAASAVPSSAESVAPETPPWKSHPGQLPDGGDQDHNDVSPPADPGPAAPPRLAAADPGLGNVPVTGADPAETRRG
jgi:Tat protein translocase TatB subunit